MTDNKALEPKAPMLVYLDHSILNQILKGRPRLRDVLSAKNLQVVFSDANLNEISNSEGRGQDFLSLLGVLGAQYLRLVHDDQFRSTDRAVIEAIDPTAAYNAYLTNQRESPSGDGGISNLLKKVYGGYPNKTFGEIVQSGQEEITGWLDTLARELSSSSIPSEIDTSALLQALPQMKQQLAAVSTELGQKLDADAPRNQVKAIDSELGVGPKDLNNLKGPDILGQIWSRIEEKLPEGAVTFDEFFGLVRPRWVADSRPMTKLEQINSVYHQLNFRGYCRDENMPQRFDAHFRDLTHVGMASFCSLFLSGDERQVRKAQAVYEHLGVGTCVHHIPPPR